MYRQRLPAENVGENFEIHAVSADLGLGAADALELIAQGVRVPNRSLHKALEDLKRAIAIQVAARFPPSLIRAHSLANLHRWERQGVWAPVYDEWRTLLNSGDDGALLAAMLGEDDRANELRQSPPYVGMLPRDIVRRLNGEAASR